MRLPFPASLPVLTACLLLAAAPLRAVQIGDLPGEDISNVELEKSETQVKALMQPEKPDGHWLAPAVEEQLAREPTLIPLGKGAVFVPSYSEPRREPEVNVLDARGRLIKTGQTGERILLDSGAYSLRFGSGTSDQQIPFNFTVTEGHTTVVPPDWSGLIVETMTSDGEYTDAQYEVIRMGRWVNYGAGHGLTQERLQDIKAWTLPPGLYRVSKLGEGFNSLRNYITVQLNPGELSQVELIFDKTSGDLTSGGIKSFDARSKMGSNWSYAIRAGSDVNLTRTTDEEDVRKEAFQVASDVRLRANFDNVLYLGVSELFLQDNFSKERGRPLSVTSDIAQFRTTWIRRFNPWLGPYIRGTVDTHIFTRQADQDTLTLLETVDSAGTTVSRTHIDSSGGFVIRPPFDPLELAQGAGVNVEMISKYYLEASTQIGVAAHQTLVGNSYAENTISQYFRSQSLYEIGVESNLNATVRLASQAALDLRLELFAPDANASRVRLIDLTADFRFFLTRNLEIGYLYQVKQEEQVKNRFPSSHNISLRLSFNF